MNEPVTVLLVDDLPERRKQVVRYATGGGREIHAIIAAGPPAPARGENCAAYAPSPEAY